jgi:hypothetical protein
MTKPLDKYDLHDWAIDSFGSTKLGWAELRKAGVISGKYLPNNDEERALLEKCRGRNLSITDTITETDKSACSEQNSFENNCEGWG